MLNFNFGKKQIFPETDISIDNKIDDLENLIISKPTVDICVDDEYDYRYEQIINEIEEENHINRVKSKIVSEDDELYYKYYFILRCMDFHTALYNGDLEKAKEIYENNPTIYISSQNELYFREACENGHLKIAMWLRKIRPLINVSAYNEYAFRRACNNGHLKVAKWLLKTKPTINISAGNDYAFNRACRNGHIEIAKWLQSLCPEKYHLEISMNIIVSYKVNL